VAVRSVEIKHVTIPPELQPAMSGHAQAGRENDARVTLASAEREIATQVVAAALDTGSPHALQLRQMNPHYEIEPGAWHLCADPDRDGEPPGHGGAADPGRGSAATAGRLMRRLTQAIDLDHGLFRARS
jgi:hypothetical protein